MLEHTLLGAILLIIIFTASATAAQTSVDLAMEALGSGSTAQMTSRVLSRPITILGKEHCQRAILTLPPSLREHRITSGKLWTRVADITRPVIELLRRTERVELFLYRGDVPQARLWMGCILLISDSLAAPLYDEELAGIVAHELAHSYFMDEMIKAQRDKDELMMRTIELECDGVAMLSLKLLGHRPELLGRGLKRITDLMREAGFEVQLHGKSHPTLVERAQFAARFIGLLGS